jgi:hypothetical protein
MPSFRDRLKTFLRGPDLEGEARRTYRFHLAYAVLDATAGGILLNMTQVAMRLMAAPNWQLNLREVYAGVGMLATLYLGSWMAPRSKMPFVFVPGVLCSLAAMSMTLAMEASFWFLTFLGVSAMFEITVRPAVAAILRLNYPAAHRGAAAGEVRRWTSLVFLASSLLCACALDWAEARGRMEEGTQALIACAALLSLASFICFRMIRVREDPARQRHDVKPEIGKSFGDAVRVVVRDGRYRRYLWGCFVDGLCAALYASLIWALLYHTFQYGELEWGFVWCTIVVHSLPALAAFVATGVLGRWFDRTNPWIAWAWIRFAWGLDALLLAVTPLVAPFVPLAIWILPVVGRMLRGSVQGGQWVMWWQIGVTHFAPPGEDTSRYSGMMVFLNGITRFAGSGAAIALAAFGVTPVTLLVVGGLGVIAAGVYSLWQAGADRKEHQPETIAEFEAQFEPTDP